MYLRESVKYRLIVAQYKNELEKLLDYSTNNDIDIQNEERNQLVQLFIQMRDYVTQHNFNTQETDSKIFFQLSCLEKVLQNLTAQIWDYDYVLIKDVVSNYKNLFDKNIRKIYINARSYEDLDFELKFYSDFESNKKS